MNAQSCISPWLCGLNLKHHRVCLYFSFQTDYADTNGRNIVYAFEMQTYKDYAPKSATLCQL